MTDHTRNTVAFISHGGGPMPLMGDSQHTELVHYLEDLAQQLPAFSAIVVFSAHWEGSPIAITHNPHPPLLFDYYGFPEDTYRLSYPCPGHPELALALTETLRAHNIPVALDAERGLDHGVFVPLMLMYPAADIPVIQVSLSSSLDPSEHINIGEALASLAPANLLFLGSGFSFHNMAGFFSDDLDIREANVQFEHWLQDTFTSSELTSLDRMERMIHWQAAPGAKLCHPREEHLLPLHICLGMTHRPATRCTALTVLGKKASNFVWLPQ